MDTNTKEIKKLTTDGGYTFPRTSSDGKHISYIKENKLWIMNADGTDTKVLNESGRYAALLGWNSSENEAIVADNNNKLFLLQLNKQKIKEVPLKNRDEKDLEVNHFIELSERSAKGVSVKATMSGINYLLITDHEDWAESKTIYTDTHTIYSPSWTSDGSGVLFVSDM
jgi:hypothetical protein